MTLLQGWGGPGTPILYIPKIVYEFNHFSRLGKETMQYASKFIFLFRVDTASKEFKQTWMYNKSGWTSNRCFLKTQPSPQSFFWRRIIVYKPCLSLWPKCYLSRSGEPNQHVYDPCWMCSPAGAPLRWFPWTLWAPGLVLGHICRTWISTCYEW